MKKIKKVKIPEATIGRLSFYSRYLTNLQADGVETISSEEIARGIAGNPAQVRKDFAYFGGFGKRGVGYNVAALNENIKEILGLNKEWKTIIIGMGNLGKALAYYHGFAARGFKIIGLFDKKVSENIHSIDDLEKFLDEHQVDIAILTLPIDSVQLVADRLVKKGIKGIINFAPAVVHAPDNVQIRNVDLSVNLEILSYNIKSK